MKTLILALFIALTLAQNATTVPAVSTATDNSTTAIIITMSAFGGILVIAIIVGCCIGCNRSRPYTRMTTMPMAQPISYNASNQFGFSHSYTFDDKSQ